MDYAYPQIPLRVTNTRSHSSSRLLNHQNEKRPNSVKNILNKLMNNRQLLKLKMQNQENSKMEISESINSIHKNSKTTPEIFFQQELQKLEKRKIKIIEDVKINNENKNISPQNIIKTIFYNNNLINKNEIFKG